MPHNLPPDSDINSDALSASHKILVRFNDSCQRILPLLGAIFTLTSCIVLDDHPYPNAWEKPPTPSEGVCMDLGGTFDEHGEGIPEENKWTGVSVRNLSMYFWPSNSWKTLRPANYVVIEQSGNVMRVSRWTLTALVTQKELKKDQADGYSCTSNGITLNRPGHSSTDNFLGYVNRTVTVFKDTKGSMVLKLEQSAGGAFVFIPNYVSDTLWGRYPPFQQNR